MLDPNLSIPIEPSAVRSLAAAFLREDVGAGDLTTGAVVDVDHRGRARIEARESCIVAGLEIASACFDIASQGTVKWLPETTDGTRAQAAAVIARLDGPLAPILTAERTALNLLQRMSGVATQAARFVEAIAGTPARIVDTRKTTPGLRLLERYAVRVGGASNHRSGLDDGILIKDNHLAAVGGDITEAVTRARARAPHSLRIEVEVTSLEGLQDAVAAGADIVLLDNFSPDEVRQAVKAVGGKAILEASSGITLDNVRAYAEAGVDVISIGALTHSARAVDLALEVES